ncbi:MAG: acyltransferase [Armatimonadota bacterium]|nr:acyltransferase [bacterium]
MNLFSKISNWVRMIGRECRTFPRHWALSFVNALMYMSADDEVSAILRAKFLGVFGVKAGYGAMVRQGVRLGGFKLTVGSFASIGACCHIDCHDAAVIIGDHAVLSPKVTIVTGTHTTDNHPGRIGPTIGKSVHIEEGAWICVGACILPGVTIGKRSVVAAGSVVTSDVPDNVMVAGVPAKVVKQLD